MAAQLSPLYTQKYNLTEKVTTGDIKHGGYSLVSHFTCSCVTTLPESPLPGISKAAISKAAIPKENMSTAGVTGEGSENNEILSDML